MNVSADVSGEERINFGFLKKIYTIRDQSPDFQFLYTLGKWGKFELSSYLHPGWPNWAVSEHGFSSTNYLMPPFHKRFPKILESASLPRIVNFLSTVTMSL